MNGIKYWFLKIKRAVFPNLFSSENMVSWLKINSTDIGKGTVFYSPGSIIVDCGRPCLLSIGEYCKITSGVIILTHDYSRSVLRRVYGEIVGEGKKTIIGNNVFIGMNSIILMGTQIGNNVIVGAGSVVSGHVPDNVVVAGNPARVIRTLDEHYQLRKKKSFEEAHQYARDFFEYYKRNPTIQELDPFYPLFLERNMNAVLANKLTIRLGGDNNQEVADAFLQSTPYYAGGYHEFLEACGLTLEEEEK